MIRAMLQAALASLTLCAVLSPAVASDHADPIGLETQTAGLTGLFVFPDGDRMIVILGTRRNLPPDGPYDLEPYELTIHIDLDSAVSYDDPATVARYGGEVVEPAEIEADAEIRLRLTDDVEFAEGSPSFEGLQRTDAIRATAGVFDDPFILPSFFRNNIIAMVLSIPFDAFPADQRDWLMWATTSERGGDRIDHVGRANRTQLPRLDFLNTLPPKEHVAAIERRHEKGRWLQRILMNHLTPVANLFQYVLEIRSYDYQPDVLIFTTRRDPGFPNGRRLTDDVAGLTCQQGDCILVDQAAIATKDNGEGYWPRPTTNDKPFRDDWPYLASPWPNPDLPEAGGIGTGWVVVGLIVALIVVVVLINLLWWLIRHKWLSAARREG